MGLASSPVSSWTSEQVGQWLASLQLPKQVTAAFAEHHVVGADLPMLTAEDLTGSFACTPWQAKKLQAELAKLGAGGAPTVGYPAPPTPMPVSPTGPPPPPQHYPPPQQQYPPASYPPQALAHQRSGLSAEGSMPLGSPTSSAREMELERLNTSRQLEMDKLRAELDRERLKAEMRQEMETKARLAAMEAAAANRQVAAPAAAPIVVSNNMQQTSTAAASAAAGGYGRGPPQSPSRVVREEKYCGCCSCLLFFIFPCIVCCPVDTKPVVYEQAYVKVGSKKSSSSGKASAAISGLAAGIALS